MPFLILIFLFATLFPLFLGAFFEWSFNPFEWGWYTRLMIVVIYAYFGWIILRALEDMKLSYYGTHNRKNEN